MSHLEMKSKMFTKKEFCSMKHFHETLIFQIIDLFVCKLPNIRLGKLRKH